MSAPRFLIIGAGLAGNDAAKQLRKLVPESAITLIGEEAHAPYDRPPLSKDFLKGKLPEAKLFFDAADALAKQQITLLTNARVTKLDLTGRQALLADGRTLPYDQALLATGGRPIRLKGPGFDLPGVHYLRGLDDARALASEVAPGKRAVIIGGGFIGMELAASLTELGVHATVIEDRPHIWARFLNPELADFFQGHCAAKGITFRLGQRVTHLLGDQRVRAAVTSDGTELPCDFVCVGVGILPNVELAREAGLKVDNGIVVDAQLRSSDSAVFAAGDVINYPDPLSGSRRRVEHWSHAKYGGRLAAQNMAGQNVAYDNLGFVWSDIFDLHLKFLGDEHQHDQMLVRGAMSASGFSVLYLKGEHLAAAFAINPDPREFTQLRRLILSKVPVSQRLDQLSNPGTDLKTLT